MRSHFRTISVVVSLILVQTVLAGAATRKHESDPTRPVCVLRPRTATLQWYTEKPCETRVHLRKGDVPCMTPVPPGKTSKPWQDATIVEGPPGMHSYHRITLTKLDPSTRYYYRVYDSATETTGVAREWGAEQPWRRERAFSTLAEPGRRTVIRVPVKVLIIPNVISVSSAYDKVKGLVATVPPKLTEEEIEILRNEYRMCQRFFFINNGFRIWYDFQLFFDDRWQRWGEEPENADGFFKGLPVCRSWAGVDYSPPGGGTFTAFDTGNIEQPGEFPLFEKELYVGQIEQTWPRYWNAKKKEWEFRISGGGTLGFDSWMRGVPGRCQYLGGDVCWLATHEFHHQTEGMGYTSGMDREDDRVVFCHPFRRHRTRKDDGSIVEFVWETSGRFGQHSSSIANNDRALTDIQWLRWYYGEAISVADRDEDGVPDDDARLPFDEKRFGSDPAKVMTDGEISDFDKIRLSIWTPGSLQTTWTRPDYQPIMPKPRDPDSDGDGIIDSEDPAPLIPYPPFVWPHTAKLDGIADEWKNVPLSGVINAEEMNVALKHCHDNDAYYGLIVVSGDWADVTMSLDGEADGVYGIGIEGDAGSKDGYDLTFRPSENGANVHVKSRAGGFSCTSKVSGATTVIEFKITNRGESSWFWKDGGREIGVWLDACLKPVGRIPMFDSYENLYAKMLPMVGKPESPVPVPKELSEKDATLTFDFSSPDSLKQWTFEGDGWAISNGAIAFTGDHEVAAYIGGLTITNFQIWVDFEAERDMILGGFKPTSTNIHGAMDYIAFMGGYDNTRSKMRVIGGTEVGGDNVPLPPGRHTMQFTKRDGYMFLQFNNGLIGWFHEQEKPTIVGKLGMVGAPGSEVRVYKMRMKY